MTPLARGNCETQQPRRVISRRRLLTAPSMAGVALTAITACGNGQSRARRLITIWTFQQSEHEVLLNELARAFEALHPQVQVNVVPRPPLLTRTLLQVGVKSGEGPDLCILGRSVIAERAAEGLLLDLDDRLANHGTTLQGLVHDQALRDVTYRERQFGIPLDIDARMLILNRDRVTEALGTVPELDATHGPMTFETLAGLGEALTVRDTARSSLEHVGFLPMYDEASPFSFLHAWGARYFNESACAFDLDTNEANFAATWVQAACSRLGPQALFDFYMSRQGSGISGPGRLFQDGLVSIWLAKDSDLMWARRTMGDAAVDATYLPVAASGMTSTSLQTGTAIALVKGARGEEDAIELMRFLASRENLDRFCDGIGRIPAQPEAVRDALVRTARPAFIEEVVRDAVGTGPIPVAAEFRDMLTRRWDGIMLEGKAVNEALTHLDQECNDLIQKSGLC